MANDEKIEPAGDTALPSTKPVLPGWAQQVKPTKYEEAGMVALTPPAWVADAQTRAYIAQLAGAMEDAEMLPPGMNKASTMVVMFAGFELGMAAMESVQNLTCINNRIGWYTRALQARMQMLGMGKVETIEATDSVARVRVTNSRTGVSEESAFTLEDATTAGYYPPVTRDGKANTRSPWHGRRADMLWNRAASRGIKRTCPEAFGNLSATESDLDDIGVDAPLRATVTETPPPPAEPAPRFLSATDIEEMVDQTDVTGHVLAETVASMGFTRDRVPTKLRTVLFDKLMIASEKFRADVRAAEAAEAAPTEEPEPAPEPDNPLADEEAGGDAWAKYHEAVDSDRENAKPEDGRLV